MERNKKVEFVCCFCGKRIEDEVCQLNASIDADEKKFITWQLLWCHKNCLRNRLNKLVKYDFVLGDKK